MGLDKKEFMKFAEKLIVNKMQNRTDREKDYVRLKCGQSIDLFIELEKKKTIKNLTSDYSKVESEINNCLQNASDLNKFRADLSSLIEKRLPTGSTQITLKDEMGNSLDIGMNQYVVFCGVTYSILCELMKFIFIRIVDFTKFSKKDMTGIGTIMYALRDNGLPMVFFEHIDNKLRNSFIHMDFEIKNTDGGRIYCDFDEKIYTSNYWKILKNRTSQDNLQKDYIKITDLIWQNILVDLSTFSLIGCVVYVMRKLFKNQSPSM